MYRARQSTLTSDITSRIQCVLAAFMLLFAANGALADGTETLGPPSIPISTGSGAVANGVGTLQAQPVDLMLMVPAGATVNQVLLYWADRYDDGVTPDDTAIIDGIPVVGTVIGGPTPPALSGVRSIAYREDITGLGLIGPGMNTVSIGGLIDTDGAGIVVIYGDGNTDAEIQFRDGADYANAGLQPGDPILGEYVPQTYNFIAEAADRMATMTFFAADAQGGRSDRYDIYVDDVLVATANDAFAATAGPQWDVIDVDFIVAAGATSVRVEIFSGPGGGKGRPDSFVWIGGFLDIMSAGTPSIAIEKQTNGIDADNPAAGDAPIIAPGDIVNWSYIVTNTGDLPLTNVSVTDDQGVAVSCPQDTLAPMESIICTASGLAEDLDSTGFTTVPGLCGGFPNLPLYQNMGTATGQTLGGGFTEDMDPSHYCNPQEPSIDIEKATNGVDADDPAAGDAPQIAVGELVSWVYVVTNTGTVPLNNVTVTDDQGVPVSCPMDTLAVGESMICTASGLAMNLNKTANTVVPGNCGEFPDTALYENIGLATGETVIGQFVQDSDPSHYCNPQMPSIDIEKATNGVDADDPNAGDAPQIMTGGLVSWTYVVTNTGNTPLNDILVTDDQGVPVSCPQDTLAPGESMICTASGIAEDLLNTGFTTVPGLCGSFPNTPTYENRGAATGVTASGGIVQNDDVSHYCNPQSPAIDIEKATNGDDADDPNGADVPQIAPGDPVSWSYVVTNTGNTTLSGITVTDDQGVAVVCPMDTLAPGESMICTADGVADDLASTGFTTVPGLCGGIPNVPVYENMGQATGETSTGDFVQHNDASHYCNPQEPAINIEKSTNGIDADDPNAGDAPQIMPGGVVSWTYVVTNSGSVTLSNVIVVDDQGVPVSCPMDTLLPGESMICTANGTADDLVTTGFTTVPGLCGAFPQTPLYQNLGLASGETALGGFVEDADASHYCNPQEPSIDIEKATNGVDADSPNAGDAPQIMAGAPVNWTYVVTNTGNTTLNDVSVTDDQGVVVSCPQATLAPGESMICTAAGVADDLLDTAFTTVPGLCGGFPGTPMYENRGIATGTTLAGDFLQALDPSHYCNPQMPGIDIEKATNGIDADDPNADDAPRILPGDVVNWTYVVTNTGNTILGGVTVTDDQGVIVSCPMGTLQPGESMICTGSGIAVDLGSDGVTTVPGICDGPNILYENIGTVKAKTVLGGSIFDEDPSHYCNPPMPAIDIEKATNGVDADDPNAGDAPQVMAGDVVNWTYVVTNTGNTTLIDVSVTDDQGVPVACPMDTLTPGQSMICTASGIAGDLQNTGFTTVPGVCNETPGIPLYENIGAVMGQSPGGVIVNDTDPSHYCNPQAPGIDIEKFTNGMGADDPNAGDAPQIMAGDLVIWSYLVTNTGSTTLTGVVVSDDQGVAVSCPMDTLVPGESMICTASGLADDLLSTGFTTVSGLCGTLPNTPLYENMGTATGQSATGGFVEDVDASHYCNPQTPSIAIEKATNGVDADAANAGDAPQIMAGELVSWTYVVTNTGNVTVNGIVVSDDQGVAVSCPQDMLTAGESMICTASGLADDLLSTGFTTVPGLCGAFPQTPLYENMGSVTGQAATGDFVDDVDPSHYCNPQSPSIDIEKATNGVDADDPNAGDAPQIAPGDLVSWTYVVTNTGNTTLTGVVVTDDQGVPVACPMDTLDPGESMICSASGLADDLLSSGFTTVPGLCGEFPQTSLYENMGVVTGQSATGGFVEDVDASHYCNPQSPGIDIEKATNGVDADDPNAGDAPAIAPGELVSWSYLVTNTGNTTLNNVVVTDDQGVPVACPEDTLDPGESMLCSASGLADDLLSTGFTTVLGLCGEFPNTPLYENMGLVTGQSVDGEFVDDVDPSHYCNPQTPGIDIEKSTNGVDADDPNAGDAPQIMAGGLVNWTYLVTNTGNTTLSGVTVTDDQSAAVTCPQDTLTPGESMICTASGLADDLLSSGFTTVPGLCGAFPGTPMYENLGMATGQSESGELVQDVDPSHYCNPQTPSIDIEKATNGVDADNPNAGDAPAIAIGNAVNWTYVVTNTGNTTLTGVAVNDDQGVAVTCPMDTLEPGESMLCTANGVADDLANTAFTTVPGLCAGFPNKPMYENKGDVVGTTPSGELIRDVDPSHYCNPPMPNLDIEKSTNGVDADDPNAGDAPVIAAGNVVSWTYLVTNTGDVTLFNIVVTDDQGVAVSCPQAALMPGASMICTASGIADDLDSTAFTTVPGLCAGFPQEPMYENMGTVTGDTVTGMTLTDVDPSHYCNPPSPAITVEKATNGVDADDPNAGDAPQIMPGDVVNWTYLVTNTGDVTLFNVTVNDDQGVAVTCPQDTLNPGESMICTASGLAENTSSTGFNTVPGVCNETPNVPLYRNLGIATGDTVTGATVQDDDPSHYCNITLSVCLPTFDFEVDSFGEPLMTGQIIDDEYSAYGVQVSSADPVNNPIMIFDSAFPTGGDPDLGTPNEDFGGPGIGAGGGLGQSGANFLSQGNVLIISEDGDSGDPDDNAAPGTMTFSFDSPVEFDSIGILDIDNQESMGTVTAYDENDAVILSVPMLELGSNSYQRLNFQIDGVRRIDVWFPSSGAVTDITFCPDDDYCVLAAEPDPQFSTSSYTHSFWLPGIDTDLAFVPDPGSFIENEDGTAVMSGSLHSLANPGRGFDVVVTLADRTDVPPPGSPKLGLDDSAYVDNGGPIDPATWHYYPTLSGVMNGTGDYAGSVIEIVPTGGAFQIGVGANGKNLNFGASSWFLWTVTSQPSSGSNLPATGQGDINVDLRLECVPDVPGVCVDGNVRDKFDNNSFNNNDGSFDWSGAWIENDPASGGAGPDDGHVTVAGGALMLNDWPDTGGFPSAAREVDLSPYSSAILSFDFWTTAEVDESDAVTVEISSDGGATFTTLEVITNIWGEVSDWRSFDISAYISSQTQVRFRVSKNYGGDWEMFKVHSVKIEGFCADAGPSSVDVLDKFNNTSFDGNNGPDNWAGSWMEEDPESGGSGPDSGAVKVRNNSLRLDDQEDTGGDPAARRQVDLTGMNQATLSFTYDISDDVDDNDAAVVEISSDGVNFTVLETFTDRDDGDWGSRSFDISAFISANTTVRFRISAYYGGSSEYFYADNVGISASN